VYDRFSGIIEDRWMYTSTIATFVSGAIAAATSGIGGATTIITILVFCTFLTTILFQILVFLSSVKGNLTKLEMEYSSLVDPSGKERLRLELHELVEQREDVGKLLIICYGTGGYHGIITKIDDGGFKNPDAEIDVMVCCPDSGFCINSKDCDEIKNVVNDIKSKKVRFKYSKTPTSVRACVVYDKKGKPMWCCTQIYSYKFGEKAKYDKFHSIVCREKDNPVLMKQLREQIESEFERLSLSCIKNCNAVCDKCGETKP
jgi:hypothetical protein